MLAGQEGFAGGWLFGLVVLGVAGLFAWGLYAARKKRERLAAFAASIGWTYESSAPQLVGRWRGQPFNLGDSKRASHLMAGTHRGRHAAAFEYQYSTGSGKSRSTTVLTVTMLALPTYLPDLEITNEGLGARIAKVFGGQDIQFESEEFNRRWRVEAAVRKTAHDIVHPRFMEFMVAGPSDPLRFEGTDVWTWHLGGISVVPLHERLDRLARAVDLIPRHVWQDHGHDPHPAAGGTPGTSGSPVTGGSPGTGGAPGAAGSPGTGGTPGAGETA